MTDQPWLDGEVEVLDPLIDLWDGEYLHWTLSDWEVHLAYAFMQAIRFYYPLHTDGVGYLLLRREQYERGVFTRDTLKLPLMNFDRFAKRAAERGAA